MNYKSMKVKQEPLRAAVFFIFYLLYIMNESSVTVLVGLIFTISSYTMLLRVLGQHVVSFFPSSPESFLYLFRFHDDPMPVLDKQNSCVKRMTQI